LTAFTRAIRCHRRFARLAPRFFDSAVVDREARDRQERQSWMAMWEPVLTKVYGPKPDSAPPADTLADLPPLPGPRTQRAVERELAGWSFWMAAGRLAMARHKQRRPHALPSLTQLTRLIKIQNDFARLACGLETCQPNHGRPSISPVSRRTSKEPMAPDNPHTRNRNLNPSFADLPDPRVELATTKTGCVSIRLCGLTAGFCRVSSRVPSDGMFPLEAPFRHRPQSGHY